MHDDGTRSAASVTTWHHGLIANWWANFNVGGPEIEYFASGAAARGAMLDVGCGTGRLLVPWLQAGLDVDGVDPSADMVDACRRSARDAGFDPFLAVQAVHELALPRSYGTIVLCGAFGLGGTRAQDVEGLRRARAHLAPGGVLLLDSEVSDFDLERLRGWQARPANVEPPAADERRLAPDGFHYSLRHRIVGVDHDERTMEREMQAWQWRDGELVGHETHALRINLYTPDEIVAALRLAGFGAVEVVGGYHGGAPTGDERFLVYRATDVS